MPDKVRFNTDLPADIDAMLDALASEMSATRSYVVRVAIMELAKQRGIERTKPTMPSGARNPRAKE